MQDAPKGNRPRRVVIKFNDGIGLPYEAGVQGRLEDAGIGSWSAVDETVPGLTLRPLLRGVKPDRVAAMVREAAERDPDYKPIDFLSFFAIDCSSAGAARAVLEAVTTWKRIDNAYIEAPAGPPPAIFNDPLLPMQRYEKPAPQGIDAEFAWLVRGGQGHEIGFVDMETGWRLDHPDLPAGIPLIEGFNHEDARLREHGLAMLAIVVATAGNGLGMAGIAPRASARVISPINYHNDDPDHAGTILRAADVMARGDVLLIEQQVTWSPSDRGSDAADATLMPVEVNAATWEAIRLATGRGIVVVEAAGNGSTNLDAMVRFPWWDLLHLQTPDHPLRLSGPGFTDSRAIMVGASEHPGVPPPWGRLEASNFGSRIDCFAHGHGILSAGPEPPDGDPNGFRTEINGTSGASAIIAGAAAVVNGIVHAHSDPFNPSRLDSHAMRNVLGSRDRGTASRDPGNDQIGVMPDLRRIIEEDLRVTAPVFVRDHADDTGVPHGLPLDLSPDILMLDEAPADLLGAFGDQHLPDIIQVSGRDKYVVWRIARSDPGSQDLTEAGIDLYWCASDSELLTPSSWRLLQSSRTFVEPAGRAGLFRWPRDGQEARADAGSWLNRAHIDPVPFSGPAIIISSLRVDPDITPRMSEYLDPFADLAAFEAFVRREKRIAIKRYTFTAPFDLSQLPGCRTLAARAVLIAAGAAALVLALVLR
jgi:hypothetical protein